MWSQRTFRVLSQQHEQRERTRRGVGTDGGGGGGGVGGSTAISYCTATFCC